MNTKKLQAALLAAFDNGSLTRLLKGAFDVDLEAITQGKNLEEKVFEVIRWAEQHGKLKMLLIEASRENPNNPNIKEVMEATFIDETRWVVGTPALYEYGGSDEVANEFYASQIIELNKQIAKLSSEIRKLTEDWESISQTQIRIMQELSLRNAPVNRRTEVYLLICLGLLVLFGGFLALRLGGVV